MNLLRLLPALFLVLAPLFVHAGEYPFSVERIKLDGGAGILAVNDGPLTVSASVDLARQINVGSDHTWPINFELKPYSSKTLGVIYPASKDEPWNFELLVSKTIHPGKVDAVRKPEAKGSMLSEAREDARSELQKLLEPVSGLPRWFDTAKIGSSFLKDGLPFLLVAYLVLLTVLFDLRAFTALLRRDWLPAIGQGCLAGATGFLLWIQHAAVPTMYLPRFMKYVMREPTSIIPCILALIIAWLTAQWLVPQRDSSQYARL